MNCAKANVFRSCRLALPFAVLLAATAVADDTELFVTGFDAPASCNIPNVLFIIDTSGSMADPVLTQPAWDPEQAFDGCYDKDAIYFSRTGEIPDCDSTDRFAKAGNYCDASAERLALVGRYQNLFRGYDDTQQLWSPLEVLTAGQAGTAAFPVDCEADRGLHGDGAGGDAYIADDNGSPWAADETREPSWAAASNVTIFDGNWLNWNASPATVERPRLEVVQEVTNAVIDSMDAMNVGVMRFNYEEGGAVVQAMTDLETSREDVKGEVNGLNADGFTPLSETLYEAGQYLAGRLVDYGDVGPEVSVPASRVGGNAGGTVYNSPIQDAGQKSYIILLSDGEPTEDVGANGKITALPGFGTLVGPGCDGSGNGACLDDMAEYLFKADLRDTIDNQQNVITHTIGFTEDLPILESTAARGGGRYYRADNAASLTQALADLADSVEQGGGLFTAPAIPVNAFNQAESQGDVYVSVFEPSNTVRWPGNLKKYRVAVDRDEQANTVDIMLVDANNQVAINPATGYFLDSAESFWSGITDGNDPTLGGAASRLPGPATRRVLTNVASNDLNAPGGENRLETANPAVTAALLGAPAAERDAVIAWARGVDVKDEDGDGDSTDARRAMGDPLHSRPVSILYGGTEDSPDSTVYVTTNEGYLHAVDADTGVELWSFIPQRLLSRLYALYTNNESATRLYGLDGEITVTIENNDGQPGIAGDEQVILVFGMRRGGDAVFAVDVTDRNRPVLLWERSSASAGFASLGQTWSPPTVATVNVGGTDRRVAIFGGGYDSGQDNRIYREDSVGNAIFMVDVQTGQRVWSAGRTVGHDLQLDRMRFSIPAELRLVDIDGDGRVDRLYFGDMGGQLWRIDLVNGQPAAELGEGGVLASLGGAAGDPAPDPGTVRRFFAAPDAVPVIEDERIYISLNIGSGYRSHPLDTDVDDQFFSVRDFNVFGVIATEDYPEPLVIDDLLDVTFDGAPVLQPDDAGWRFGLVLGAGEKVLSQATTFANTVFFTSFTPANVGNACVAAGGFNRLYRVDILDASPQTNLDEPFVPADRTLDLNQGGIAPEPVFVFPADLEGPVLLVGTEQPLDGEDDGQGGMLTGPGLIRTFWLQREGP